MHTHPPRGCNAARPLAHAIALEVVTPSRSVGTSRMQPYRALTGRSTWTLILPIASAMPCGGQLTNSLGTSEQSTMRRKLDTLLLTLCLAWITILGGLGISAIVRKQVSLGTRIGVSASDGVNATGVGLGLIGFALLGLVPLLDGNRFRSQAMALVTIAWIVGSICVLRWGH